MIDLVHLTKTFDIDSGPLKAVDDISFHVDKGEIYGIIGLSGAGKSTLVRCINRLEEPTSGKIIIDGVDIGSLSKADLLQERRQIGMIFQSFNLFSQKTIRKNIEYPLELMKMDRSEIRQRSDQLLDFIGLKAREKAYPAELSGGQKQRVAIARALATKPKILLSDEGTSALDPKNTKSVLDLLKEATEEFGTTIIMITHQMEVAKDICDRIAVMENGRIVEENKTEDLFLNPQHPITKTFIARLNQDEEPLPGDFKVEGDLLKLTYDYEVAKEPIITDVARECGVSMSILQGRIDTLKYGATGYMLVELSGGEDEKDKALKAFKDRRVHVEVVK